MDEVHLVFDDNVEQNVSKTWVVQRMRAWDWAAQLIAASPPSHRIKQKEPDVAHSLPPPKSWWVPY